MDAETADAMSSPEWTEAREEWRQMATAALDALSQFVSGAGPGQLSREQIYGPVHDIAGLAGVFDYLLLTRVARALMERLRAAEDPLEERTLSGVRAYLAAMTALHAKDLRGDTGSAGEGLLARLAEAAASMRA